MSNSQYPGDSINGSESPSNFIEDGSEDHCLGITSDLTNDSETPDDYTEGSYESIVVENINYIDENDHYTGTRSAFVDKGHESFVADLSDYLVATTFSYFDYDNGNAGDKYVPDYSEPDETSNHVGQYSHNGSVIKINNSPVENNKLHHSKTPAKLWKYFSPPLVITGTIGNALTLSVLSRKRFMKKSVTMYLIFLTIAHTILLDVNLSYRWLKVVTDFDMKLISDTSCKLHSFTVYSLHQLTSWMIVLATVDRSLTLFYPWWARDTFSHACSAVLIGMAVMCTVVFNVHFLFTRELFPVYHKQTGTRMMTCNTYLQRHRWFVHSIWPWIDISLFALVPFAVIIICNGCIVGQLVTFYGTKKTMKVTEPASSATDTAMGTSSPATTLPTRNHIIASTTSTHNSTLKPFPRSATTPKTNAITSSSTSTPPVSQALVPEPMAQESSTWKPKLTGTTKMVFFINAFFLTTNLPLCVVLMGEMCWLVEASDEKKEELHIIWVIVNLIANVFSACKFVLYWSVSRRFRKTFCRMFKKHRVEPGDTLMEEQNTAGDETVC